MIKIASPLADENTTKRLQKIIKDRRGTPDLHRGIKHCQKKLLDNAKGILVLTADTTPMDLITHLPAICEENDIPYIFVSSQLDLKIANPKSGHITCCFIEIKEDGYDDKTRKIISKCYPSIRT